MNDIIYIGISEDVDQRWAAHCRGAGAKITRKYKPLAFTVLGEYKTKKDALHAETGTVNVLRVRGFKAYGGSHCTIKAPQTIKY